MDNTATTDQQLQDHAAAVRLGVLAPRMFHLLERVKTICIDGGDDLSNEAFYGDELRELRAIMEEAGDQPFCKLPTPLNTTLKKTTPKGFKKEASSSTLDGILTAISRYYCGENKDLHATGDPSILHVYSKGGKKLSTVVIQTTRGYFFGYFSQP